MSLYSIFNTIIEIKWIFMLYSLKIYHKSSYKTNLKNFII